jgi:hypothetical protein
MRATKFGIQAACWWPVALLSCYLFYMHMMCVHGQPVCEGALRAVHSAHLSKACHRLRLASL